MSQIFRIEMLPARHGDCIWIEYGEERAPRRLLIDGGPLAAYAALEARIERVPVDARNLELLVVTHVDADHIEGAVKLLNDDALGVRYRDIWFNGWPQLTYSPRDDSPRSAEPWVKSRSPIHGQYLALRIEGRGHAWNRHFRGRPVLVPEHGTLPVVELDGGMKLTLLTPTSKKLATMRSAWKKAAAALGLDPENTEAFAQRLEDDSRYRSAHPAGAAPFDVAQTAAVATKVDGAAANGASIAFVAEFEGKRCAFLADAHLGDVEASFERLAQVYGEPRLRLDAVKVSHHGSSGNMSASLLEKIDCARYLISTDGSIFGHPDDEALAQIVLGGQRPVRLLFNYRSDHNARWADQTLQQREHFTADYPTEGSGGIAVDLMATA